MRIVLCVCVWPLIEREHAFTPQPIATRANIGEGHVEESPSASPLPTHATVPDDNPDVPKCPSEPSDESPAASPVPAADEQVTRRSPLPVPSARFSSVHASSIVSVAYPSPEFRASSCPNADRIQEAPPPTPATPATPAVAKVAQQDAPTGPSPDKMTFSAKKRFFEKEITDTQQPAAKSGT